MFVFFRVEHCMQQGQVYFTKNLSLRKEQNGVQNFGMSDSNRRM